MSRLEKGFGTGHHEMTHLGLLLTRLGLPPGYQTKMFLIQCQYR